MDSMFRKIGIYHHPTSAPAEALAVETQEQIQALGPAVWISSAWDPDTSTRELSDTDLLICIGGDGTVLRGARAVIPYPVPILGVDMGRLAFLTEFTPEDLRANLGQVLSGHYRVEERTMLHVQLEGIAAPDVPQHAHVLNDVILGSTSLGHPAYLNVRVDGELIGVLRADAIVVATATGSTGYSLSAGGPILDPLSRSIAATPVAPHLAAAAPLVLPPDAVIELSAQSDGEVAVSLDGQGQYQLGLQGTASIRRSEHVARMLRFWESSFFAQLGSRLAWLDERRLAAVSELLSDGKREEGL